MAKKSSAAAPPLPPLLDVKDIQQRLAIIFPEEFPDRGIHVGEMAARVIFVFLYGGFVEGHSKYGRPSNVYLFTEEQSELRTDGDRLAWLEFANKQGHRLHGTRWYTADNSREQIRDDYMRSQLDRLGIMRSRGGIPTTSSKPVRYLTADFSALFSPFLKGEGLEAAVEAWRLHNLDPATQQRMTLRAQRMGARKDDVLIDMPDNTREKIAAGPSSLIAKDLIEQFAGRYLSEAAVLWLSSSEKKSDPRYANLSAQLGLRFDVNAVLPDLILVDLKEPFRLVFCEIVASDGAMTEARKQALLAIAGNSNVPKDSIEFLTAFEDRESPVFRKNFSKLALDTLVWFRTEPHLLVILSSATREEFEARHSRRTSRRFAPKQISGSSLSETILRDRGP